MSDQRYTVLPSVGCEFIPPERFEHQGDTEYYAMVSAHRRAWSRHPCTFTGRTVTIEQVVGDTAETVDVDTGAVVWIPMRRLEAVR